MTDRILIFGFIAINTLGRVVTDKYYFVCEAISLVLAALFFVNNSIRTTKILAQWALWLTISNLSDELFFDPCKFGWNEGVILTFATIWALTRYMKQNDRDKR